MHLVGASSIAFLGIHAQVKGPWVWAWIAGALVVGIAALFALMSVPPRYRKIIVVAVTFLGGLYLALEFLLPHHPVTVGAHVIRGTKPIAGFAKGLTDAKPGVADWMNVVGAFTLLLGTSNLLHMHGKAIRKKIAGWYNSLAFFISFFLVLAVGLLKDKYADAHGLAGNVGEASKGLFVILFNGFIQNLDAAMFSLVAFYIVSAAYRAFRVKSAETGLMMGTAAIVMLGLVPVGALLTNWLPHSGPLSALRLENMTLWILMWPNMAVQRAIEFGLSVGALAMSLRIWLSLERGSFFDRQL